MELPTRSQKNEEKVSDMIPCTAKVHCKSKTRAGLALSELQCSALPSEHCPMFPLDYIIDLLQGNCVVKTVD